MSGGAIEYGLLGRSLPHSYSPRIHAMLGDYRYELLEAEPDAAEAILSARAFRGLNVTIPYKKLAHSMCDALDDTARLTGAVNTIVNEDDYLTGYNTDFGGFLSMLGHGGAKVCNRKAAVLGGGGSGGMAAAALKSIGARVVIVSRSGPIDYDALYREHADIELLVNATPVGMYPENGASPVALERLPAVENAFDLIYNPYRTALMLDAEEKGVPARNGLWMLIAQAAAAAELFTGKANDETALARIHALLRAEMENIVLIGMPGCGKSGVGRAVAERMGRVFVDIDEQIVRRAGMPIPEIFAAKGEAHFREIERAVIAEYGREKSLVIATGGGAVLRHENMRALRQNGEVFYIDRAMEQLATEGRPLSVNSDALRRMAAERLPLYRKYGAMTVRNDGTVEGAARAVVEGFYEITGD